MDAALTRQSLMSDEAPDLIAEANHRIANSLTLLVSMVRPKSVKLQVNILFS